MTKPRKKAISRTLSAEYDGLIGDIARLLEMARRTAARTVNALMTATYWEIGRRIVEFEQKGKTRAQYGEELLVRMAIDLTRRFGRGFSRQNLQQMRQFYEALPPEQICQTPSGKLLSFEPILSTSPIELPREKGQTLSGELAVRDLSARFPLPSSPYVRLLSVKSLSPR
jgi:DUF1016 N-terminal domain